MENTPNRRLFSCLSEEVPCFRTCGSTLWSCLPFVNGEVTLYPPCLTFEILSPSRSLVQCFLSFDKYIISLCRLLPFLPGSDSPICRSYSAPLRTFVDPLSPTSGNCLYYPRLPRGPTRPVALPVRSFAALLVFPCMIAPISRTIQERLSLSAGSFW